MIFLLVLGLLIRRCWKDSKEMCGKLEFILIWTISAIYFFLIFYFLKYKGGDVVSIFGIIVLLCFALAFIELHW